MSHIALSYSRLSTYEQCPFKFASQYIRKDYPDDSNNPHFVKGQKKHRQLQNYIDCKNNPTLVMMKYDGDVKSTLPIVDRMMDAGFNLKSEQKLAVDTDFLPCDWFDKSTMYRAIVDVLGVRGQEVIIGDWKTGKYRDYDDSKTGQLHLSSCIVFALLPHIEKIYTSYFFIEHKQTVTRQFTREMYEEGLLSPFLNAFDDVNQDSEFEARRNQYCNFCLIKETKCPIFGAKVSKPMDIPY